MSPPATGPGTCRRAASRSKTSTSCQMQLTSWRGGRTASSMATTEVIARLSPSGQSHAPELPLRVAEVVSRLMQHRYTDALGQCSARRADTLQVGAKEVDRVGVRRAEAGRAPGHRHAVVETEDAGVEAVGHHLRRGTVGDEDSHVPQLVEQLLREFGQSRFRNGLELVRRHERLRRRDGGVQTQHQAPLVGHAGAIAADAEGATQQVARVRLTVEREDASGGDAAQTLGRGGRVTRGKQPPGLTQLGLESTPVYGSTTRARPRALLGPLGHGNIIDGIARTYPPLRATGRIRKDMRKEGSPWPN